MRIRILTLTAAATAALLLAGGLSCRAQRTASGSKFISIEPMVTAYCVPSFGADLNFGGYQRASYWRVGVRAADWNHRIDTGEELLGGSGVTEDDGDILPSDVSDEPMFDHVQASVYGGWRWRLISTYSRVFNVYAGADAFVGVNKLQVLKKLDEEMKIACPDEEFAYGCVPEIEMELFLGRRVALLLGVQCPITLGTSLQTDTWNLTGTLGLRFNLRRR